MKFRKWVAEKLNCEPISIGIKIAWVIPIILFYFGIEQASYIAMIEIVLIFICEIVLDSKKYLTTIKGFLSIGIMYWFFITVVIVAIIEILTSNQSTLRTAIYMYAIATPTWCFYSLLAHNKVANTANQLLSALFAMIVLSKDTILSLIPDYILSEEIEKGYTAEKIIEMAFNLTFSPMLAVNIVAVALCTLKGYWIEKYNHNQDIEDT